MVYFTRPPFHIHCVPRLNGSGSKFSRISLSASWQEQNDTFGTTSLPRRDVLNQWRSSLLNWSIVCSTMSTMDLIATFTILPHCILDRQTHLDSRCPVTSCPILPARLRRPSSNCVATKQWEDPTGCWCHPSPAVVHLRVEHFDAMARLQHDSTTTESVYSTQ